jgi:hypothetical protein
MTRLTQERIAKEWDMARQVLLDTNRHYDSTFEVHFYPNHITAFAHRIAALAVQEVERDWRRSVTAHNAAIVRANLAEHDLAGARDEIAGFEAMWEQREKAHDAETEALRAQLATAKREIEHWVLDRRAELGPQPNLTKSDAERYAWAGKMTAYDVVLGYVTDAYTATPSGDYTQSELDCRGCSGPCGQCATPSPEAREPFVIPLTREIDNFTGITITPADAKRIVAMAQEAE